MLTAENCAAVLFLFLVGLSIFTFWPTRPDHPIERFAIPTSSFAQRLKNTRIEELALRTYQQYAETRRSRHNNHDETYLMWDGRASKAPDRGLGDRFKGQSTAFYLALVLDRKFVPRFNGYDTQELPIRPILDELEARDSFALFDAAKHVHSLEFWDTDFDDANEVAKRVAYSIVGQESVTFMSFTCNGEAGYTILREFRHRYDFLVDVTPSDLFRIFAYLYLRRPGQRIVDHYNSLVVAHPILETPALRVGIQLRVSESRQRMNEAIDCALLELLNVCQHRLCAIFVSSDLQVAATALNNQLVGTIGDKSSIFTSSLRPAHIAHVSVADDLSPWFDWYMLSIQDVLFVSQSGYSLTAIKASTTVTYVRSRNVLGSCQPPACAVSAASSCEFNDCLAKADDVTTGWHYC